MSFLVTVEVYYPQGRGRQLSLLVKWLVEHRTTTKLLDNWTSRSAHLHPDVVQRGSRTMRFATAETCVGGIHGDGEGSGGYVQSYQLIRLTA